MKFSILTLFPEMFDGVFNHSILKRAIQKNLIEINFVNIRDFGIGNHKTVDDKPYGGGIGMVMKVDVLHNAIQATKENKCTEKVVIFDARGKSFKQEISEELSKIDHLILICGRYEGFDERILKYVDYSISLGDFVLTGGEIPAMVVVDSVTRLIPGVLKKNEATIYESFSNSKEGRILEHGQYTRPEEYDGMKVPEILLSGHNEKISEFRNNQRVNVTNKNRPDLIDSTPQE